MGTAVPESIAPGGAAEDSGAALRAPDRRETPLF